MDFLIAMDELDDLLLKAPPVPLTGSVRLDERALRGAIGRLRAAADEQVGGLHAQAGPIGAVFTAIDELEAIARSARPIPLTSQTRVESERVYDRLDHLRATFPVAVREARGE